MYLCINLCIITLERFVIPFNVFQFKDLCYYKLLLICSGKLGE